MTPEKHVTPFVGESRELIVEGMFKVYGSVKTTGEPRWISLEAPPGWGKSRLGRELYARLAETQQDPHYWPAVISGKRKIVHPNPFAHVADSVPDYLWWGISCTARDGIAMNTLRADLEQFERHEDYIDDAVRSRRSRRQQVISKLNSAGRTISNQAGVEAAARFVTAAIGFSTGLGLLIEGVKTGADLLQARSERKRRSEFEGSIGTDIGSNFVEYTTGLLQNVTDTGLPLVVLIEDLHHTDDLLVEAIDSFLSSLTHFLLITTTWPEEIDKNEKLYDCITRHSDRVYRLTEGKPLGYPFERRARMERLDSEGLSAILRHHFPKVDSETEERLLDKYNNPGTLEIVCELPAHKAQYPGLKLSAKRVQRLSSEIRDLHLEHWNQLSPAHRVGLAVASIITPRPTNVQEFTGANYWDHKLAQEMIGALEVPKLSSEEILSEVDRSTSVHGWVRRIDEYLRAFLEPTQEQVVSEEGENFLEDRIVDARDTILGLLAVAMQESSEDHNLVHRSQVVLSLCSEGHLANGQEVATAIEAILSDLHEMQPAIEERCRLFRQFMDFTPTERCEVDAETRESLLHYGATALQDAGRNEEARDAFEDLLSEQEELLGKEDRYTLETRHSIATQQAEMGHVDSALASLHDLLSDRQRILQDDRDPDILMNRHDIAYWQAYSGRTQEAVDQYRILVDASEEIFGPTARVTLRRKQLLASELSNLGEHDEAMSLTVDLVDQFEETLGKEHPDTLIARQRQAVMLGQSNQAVQAVLQLERIVDDCYQVLPRSHPTLLRIRHDYAQWLSKSGDHDKALAEFLSLIEDSENQLGRCHIDTLVYCRNFASALSRSGDTTQAIAMLEDLAEEYSQVLEESHIDTLSTRRHLAIELAEAKEFDRALETLQTLSSDYDEALGPEDRRSMELRYFLGVCHFHAKQYGDAIATLSDLLVEQKEWLGVDDADTKQTTEALANAKRLVSRGSLSEFVADA